MRKEKGRYHRAEISRGIRERARMVIIFEGCDWKGLGPWGRLSNVLLGE